VSLTNISAASYGRVLILINRNDYFQAGYVIAKGL
jgi:hypothetical protein